MILIIEPINPDPVMVDFVAHLLFQANRPKPYVRPIDTKVEPKRPDG